VSGVLYETALHSQNCAQETRPKPETEAKQGKEIPGQILTVPGG